MAKRAIEEEFDRLYSEFIENPVALPRLKKRAKRCSYPNDNTYHHGSTASASHDETRLCVSGKTDRDDRITTGDLSPVSVRNPSLSTSPGQVIHHSQDLQTHKPSTDNWPPACNSTSQQCNNPGGGDVIDDVISCSNFSEDTDDTIEKISPGLDVGQSVSDIFMLHKPRISRLQNYTMQQCLNLDVLWAMYAKTWFRPKFADRSQHRPPVFLKRTLKQGKVFFKRYLSHQEALNNLPSCQGKPPSSATCPSHYYPSTQDAAVKTETESTQDGIQGTKKLKCNESNRAQKRKEHKPKLHIGKKPNKAKMETAKDAPQRRSRDAVTKAPSLKSKTLDTRMKQGLQKVGTKGKHILTHKKVWKKDETVSTSSLVTSNKQIWTKEDAVGRQVAICRPNTKGRTSNQSGASTPKIKPAVGEHLKFQLDTPQDLLEGPVTAGLPGGDKESQEAEDSGGGIKTLFTGKSGHCGGIWKSIVDEC